MSYRAYETKKATAVPPTAHRRAQPPVHRGFAASTASPEVSPAAHSMSSPNAGHNFGRVQVWPAGSQGSSKKLAVNASGTAEASAPAKGIGASGTIDIAYKPEAKDKSSKIVFIQVMRELLDGTPEKPSVLDKDFAYE